MAKKEQNLQEHITETDGTIVTKIGQTTYTPAQALAEYIDNSLCARLPGKPAKVNLSVVEEAGRWFLEYEDHGGGIDPKTLGQVFALGKSVGGGLLNNHGMGFKQSTSAMGRLDVLESSHAQSGRAFTFDGASVDNEVGIPFNQKFKTSPNAPHKQADSGVFFRVELGRQGQEWLQDPAAWRAVRNDLGVLFQDTLGKDLILTTTHRGISDQQLKPVKPVLFNPVTREPGWMANRIPLGRAAGDMSVEWSAYISLGYIANKKTDPDAYSICKATAAKQGEPYSRKHNSGGIDVFYGLRRIALGVHGFGTTAPIYTNHTTYNGVHGLLELGPEFETLTTKNELQVNQFMREVSAAVQKVMVGMQAPAKGGGNTRGFLNIIAEQEKVYGKQSSKALQDVVDHLRAADPDTELDIREVPKRNGTCVQALIRQGETVFAVPRSGDMPSLMGFAWEMLERVKALNWEDKHIRMCAPEKADPGVVNGAVAVMALMAPEKLGASLASVEAWSPKQDASEKGLAALSAVRAHYRDGIAVTKACGQWGVSLGTFAFAKSLIDAKAVDWIKQVERGQKTISAAFKNWSAKNESISL